MVAEAVPFPDHHPYAEAEVTRLLERAAALGAVPLTTEKDWVRLPAAHQTAIKALPVVLAFDDPGALERVLGTVS
ncbi:tetraacyldisaccharide 4'-kinase [Nitrospirillum viridazoti Y2]|nr:tetraacyldisaccharide 4'-kinase [Nitrospirillum amazonense Y2]